MSVDILEVPNCGVDELNAETESRKNSLVLYGLPLSPINATGSIVLYPYRHSSLLKLGTMKRQLQCISYGLAIFAIVSACNKNNDVSATASPPPPPPTKPIDSVKRCDNSSRQIVSAQLVPIGKLSQARVGITVVAVGNKILFAGGNKTKDDSLGSTRVDIYDITANSWSTAELSKARCAIAAVAAGDKVFLAGGHAGKGAVNEAYATVDIYDAQSNTWSEANLSQPRYYIAAGAMGTRVLFVGGEDAQRNATYTVDSYEIATGDWSIDQISEGWANIKAVTLNDKIYFGGGYRVLPTGGGYEGTNLIHIYDAATNTWTMDWMKNTMGAVTGVAVDNRIFWAAECTVEIKNTQTGNSTNTSLFSSAYWQSDDGQSAVVKNNKIVFFRYNSGTETWFDIYDIATNTWAIGELPMKVASGAIVSVNNTIYLAGGIVNGAITDQVWKLEF